MDERDHLDYFRCNTCGNLHELCLCEDNTCGNLHELCLCEDEEKPENTEFYKLAEEMFED